MDLEVQNSIPKGHTTVILSSLYKYSLKLTSTPFTAYFETLLFLMVCKLRILNCPLRLTCLHQGLVSAWICTALKMHLSSTGLVMWSLSAQLSYMLLFLKWRNNQFQTDSVPLFKEQNTWPNRVWHCYSNHKYRTNNSLGSGTIIGSYVWKKWMFCKRAWCSTIDLASIQFGLFTNIPIKIICNKHI
jgi:hypothetical protein